MKTYSSAYKAALAYSKTKPELEQEFKKDSARFVNVFTRNGTLKQGRTYREWYIDLPGHNQPTGWYVFDGNVKAEGPYRTKREAVSFVARRCGLERPPRFTKLGVGEYVYLYEGGNLNYELLMAHEYFVIHAEQARERGWI